MWIKTYFGADEDFYLYWLREIVAVLLQVVNQITEVEIVAAEDSSPRYFQVFFGPKVMLRAVMFYLSGELEWSISCDSCGMYYRVYGDELLKESEIVFHERLRCRRDL